MPGIIGGALMCTVAVPPRGSRAWSVTLVSIPGSSGCHTIGTGRGPVTATSSSCLGTRKRQRKACIMSSAGTAGLRTVFPPITLLPSTVIGNTCRVASRGAWKRTSPLLSSAGIPAPLMVNPSGAVISVTSMGPSNPSRLNTWTVALALPPALTLMQEGTSRSENPGRAGPILKR